MKTTAGVTYTYDGDGRRVKKSNGKLYWYGLGLDALLETDLAGNTPDEYIFFGGKRIARRQSSSTVNYYFSDHLGSSRVVTNATGTIQDDSDFYPFGGERAVVTNDPNQYKFTGHERDTESSLDYMKARYYTSAQGRFLSPDEFTGGPVDVLGSSEPSPPGPLPYADIRHPKSLNKYSYANNNPLRFTDPNGHKAGDKYETLDEAGIDAAKEAQEKQKKDKKNHEYGGRLYKNKDGTYSYTKPKRGTSDSRLLSPRTLRRTYPRVRRTLVPITLMVREYPIQKPEVVGGADRTNQWVESALAREQGDSSPVKPEYIGTPTGVLRFTPDIDSTRMDPRGTPGDVHRWDPATKTWKLDPEQSWH
jgi:RHS repeat-associated protein